jgi:hypothetical protein
MPRRQRIDFQTINLAIVGFTGEVKAFQSTDNAYFLDAYMTTPTNLRIVASDEQHARRATRRVVLLRENAKTNLEIAGLIARVDFGQAQSPVQPPNTNVIYVFEIEHQKRNPFF